MTTLAKGSLLSRRQALKAGALTGAALLVAPTGAGVAAAVAPVAATAAALPVLYGTPTDLARLSPLQAFAQDSDGTVVGYDKAARAWIPIKEKAWAKVRSYGTVHLARWGRPSGGNQLVMVFGQAPKVVPPPAAHHPAPPTLANTGFAAQPWAGGAAAAVAVGAGISFLYRRRSAVAAAGRAGSAPGDQAAAPDPPTES